MSIKARPSLKYNGQDREDVMSVIESNGEVTLPSAPMSLSKRQVISALVIGGTVVALVWVALESR